MDNKNNFIDNINDDFPEWGDDLEKNGISNDEEDWFDDWETRKVTKEDMLSLLKPKISNNSENNSSSNNNIHYLDGYGQIYDLNNYLNNSDGTIELLKHAKSKEQFNHILGMSESESHDENLLKYLVSIDYSIEDYVSVKVGYRIFSYKKLVEYLLSKANDDQIKEILAKIAYADEHIASIVASRDDRLELIARNYHLRDKIVTKKIIQYFKEHPDTIDLEIINVCDLDTEIINELIDLGYKISFDSPYDILQNNDVMRDEFLKTIKIRDMDTFSKLDAELKMIPGSYGMLYKSKTKEIFNEDFSNTFGKHAFEQMIKYIVLGDYQIDLSKINDNNIKFIKDIYDSLSNKDSFDIQLFTKIIYKFNMNPNIFINFDKSNIDINKLRIYFEFKELMVNNLSELDNIETILYNYENSRIASTNNVIDLKNIICNLLTNQTYFETKKGLLELASNKKLAVLKNSIKDKDSSKKLDSFIILSDLLEKVDNIEDVTQLKEIASILNQQILKNGINYNWMDFNKKIMNFYCIEANERMTDFNEYLTDTFYDATDFTFNDGTNVNGRRVKMAHIKSGMDFNSLIHVLNAYQNGVTKGSIESVASPKFVGQAYISLTGITDEYSRICVNHDAHSSIKILYSKIPIGDMFCASNRDTGILANANSKNIYTRLPANMAPFRRLVRNTETHGSETYNEYDLFRDNLVPSGIAFMYDEPTKEEIDAAAYLGVPLVKIDDLQENFRKDIHSVFLGGLSYDQSFYHIKEHEYENQEITVSPNDKYDVVISTIKDKMFAQPKESALLEVFSEKDEIGHDKYFVMYNGEKYSTTPVYEYVDSRRENIKVDYYEKSFIKSKLYEFLGINSKTAFVNCKYPNGNEIISVIDNTRQPQLIDEYIDYLVDVPTSRIDSNELSNFSINSIEELRLLNKINSLSDNQYIGLFESLIKINTYVEPSIMLSQIIEKKGQLNSMVSKYNRILNHAPETQKLEILDMYDIEQTSKSDYIVSKNKK